jgi:hypothetical protein
MTGLALDDWILLENAKERHIDAPSICRLYADFTPESFNTRAAALAEQGLLDPGGAKGGPMTFALSELGRLELDRRDRAHSDAIKADTVRRSGL